MKSRPGETVPHRSMECSDCAASEIEIELVVEDPLEIRINGEPYARVMRTPGDDLELAAGFCITEGIVRSYSDIESMTAHQDGGIVNTVEVITCTELKQREEGARDLRQSAARQFESRSSGGMCGIRVSDSALSPAPLPDGPNIGKKALIGMQYTLVEGQRLGWITRATHAAALFTHEGEQIVVCEDIGRHNALDRAVGHAAMNGLDPSGMVLMFSGRISLEITSKCARAGIALVAAVSAASAQAVLAADKLNMTLVGRLRDDCYIAYTHPERIIVE